ncbi:MAG: response regulator transcription factor, partial [Desulfitobacterium hafniense]
ILLDLMLPGLSGEDIMPKLKGIPVIVVSAKTDIDDKVGLLLEGAVDYITKPFHMKELLARVVVGLRKGPEPDKSVLAFADIRLYTALHTVWVAEKEVRLTRTEYAILKLLMQNPAQVITKSLLLDRISEDTPDCTESSLKMHISHLRRKLREASGQDYIEAVWGIGFKLKTD